MAYSLVHGWQDLLVWTCTRQNIMLLCVCVCVSGQDVHTMVAKKGKKETGEGVCVSKYALPGLEPREIFFSK